MNNERCITCLFGDKCHSEEDCDRYTPFDDDDEAIDRYIEEQRAEFRDAWFRYTSEW